MLVTLNKTKNRINFFITSTALIALCRLKGSCQLNLVIN